MRDRRQRPRLYVTTAACQASTCVCQDGTCQPATATCEGDGGFDYCTARSCGGGPDVCANTTGANPELDCYLPGTFPPVRGLPTGQECATVWAPDYDCVQAGSCCAGTGGAACARRTYC